MIQLSLKEQALGTKSTYRTEPGSNADVLNSTFTLLCGDALEALHTLPSESVQCCVTSPPYFQLRDYGVEGQIGVEESPEQYIARLVAVFREVRRVLRPDGTLWVNIGDSYAKNSKARTKQQGNPIFQNLSFEKTLLPPRRVPANCKVKDLIGIPWMLAFALRDDGWYLRSDIIWDKPNPMPESVKDRPTKGHEYLFLLSKSPKYYYDAGAIKEPAQDYGTSDRRNNKKNGATGLPPHRGFKSENYAESGRNKRSVWRITPKPCKEAHFAVFPPELPEICILAGTPKGGIVLDPFNGSGTTGIVAVKNGRSYIGVELNPEYVEITERRAKKEVGIEVSTTVDGKVEMMNHSELKPMRQRDDIPATEESRKPPKRDEIGVRDEVERDEHGRRLIDCLACPGKRTPEAAYGLCFKCGFRRCGWTVPTRCE